MNVLIYGGGAVGLGIASCLIKSGDNVDIIARKDTILLLKSKGLHRAGIFGEYILPPKDFNVFENLSGPDNKKYDYILICTKSYDTINAAKDLIVHKFLLKKTGKIILFQNGWGNADEFITFFPKDKIYNARVITGFQRLDKNIVNITVHADSIHIGSLFNCDMNDLINISESINNGGIPCELTDKIEEDLWQKMLYNCALNPLGAVFQVPYGKLADSRYSKELMDKIIEEIFYIIKIYGFKSHCTTHLEYLDLFYNNLIPSTANHESSMLQDIRNNKKTEIEALNGAVVKLAQKKNLNIPFNKLIYNMIKFIENNYNNTV